MDFRQLTAALSPLYGRAEAQAIARMVYEERFGLSLADVLLGRDQQLTKDERSELEIIASRLLKGEPVQHVVGYATFCGRRFRVTPDVLIPRPETEMLVAQSVAFCRQQSATGGRQRPRRIMDLGTGSGCIAISLALELEASVVVAVDVSEAALAVAMGNASLLGAANVDFLLHDMLAADALLLALRSRTGSPGHDGIGDMPMFDVIVSNPPYIRRGEAAAMHANVVDHEPHVALFVPDDDPLLFYRAIADVAAGCLVPGGAVVMEANSALADDTAALFRARGFAATVMQDVFGKPRCVVAKKG